MNDFWPRLTDYLSEQTGTPVHIHSASPLAGGASRDTWLFSADIGGTTHRYVLRRDLPTQMFPEALSRAQEYRLLALAHAGGVQVAQVRYLCEQPHVLGSPFFIMDYVPGISIGRKVLYDDSLAEARRRLPQQMARQLARIHALPLADLGFLPRPAPGHSPAGAAVAATRALLDALAVHNPVWEWTLRHAEHTAPPGDRLTFIHGDFRIGNLLVDAHGLTAVIDWEFGHLGDPHEELGYACMRDWRFGRGQQRFSGLCDREPFLQAYEQAAGYPVDRAAVDWWELMGNIRWGVICLSQANRHLSGEEHSVELASLGRRSAEMQLEALRLIEQSGF